MLMLEVFLNHSPLYFLKDLSLNLNRFETS